MIASVPRANLAFIGGSGTFALDFPEGLPDADIAAPATGLVFVTPYGPSAPFKLFSLAGGEQVLTVKMHGRLPGVTWADSARRTFWVLRAAGVRHILTEAGVGSVNRLLDPGDLVVVDDYLDQSLRRDLHLSEDYLCIMRQPLCPDLRQVLLAACLKTSHGLGRVFSRGTYLVTDGRHFESPAEIRAFQQWGADVVGQNLCPEVYLAREIGACYAGVFLIVNYGEGVVEPWRHQVLQDFFYDAALPLGRIIVTALKSIPAEPKCGCAELRRPTLFRPENIGQAKEV